MSIPPSTPRRRGTRPRLGLLLLLGCLVSVSTVSACAWPWQGRRLQTAADRAEQAAARAEESARRAEESAGRLERATDRLEATVDAFIQQRQGRAR
jgi:hypothetical protein